MRLLLTVALIALGALTLTAADLTGSWKGSMETQMGNTPVVVTIAPGAVLTGKVAVAEFEGPIQKGRVEGANLSFELTIEHGTLIFEGIVAGDEMKLNVTGTQGNKYPLVCKRQK